MDVEKRTTIVAGMNEQPMTEGLARVGAAAQKTTAQLTQSAAEMSRTLLETTRGFDALQRKWVDGYKDAMTYVQAIQTITNAQKNGRDGLGSYQTILTELNRSFGQMGTAAQDAATKMLTAGKNVAQYKEGLQELITTMREVTKVTAEADAVRERSAQMMRSQAQVNQYAGVQPSYQNRAQRQRDLEATLGPLVQQQQAEEDRRAAAAAADAAAQRMRFQAQVNQSAGVQPNFQNRAQRQQDLEATLGPLVQQQADQDRMAAMSAYVARTRVAQPSQFGVQAAPTASEQAQRQSDLEDAFGTQMQQRMDTARAKYDAVFRASKDYEQAFNELNEDYKRGDINQRTYNTGLDQLNKQFVAHGKALHEATGATGQQSFAMRQLGVQAIQTFQGFATGQPIMMTLIQQGHQVADVMLSAGVSVRSLATAVGNAFASFGRFLLANPITLIVAEIAALAAGLVLVAYRAEQAAVRLSDLGNRLRATGGDAANRAARAADVEAVSRQLASTTTLGRGEAFTAGSVFTEQGFRGSRDQLGELIKQANDLSKVMGVDLPTATKLWADGMEDAAGVAQRLHDQLGTHFPGLTQAAVDQLKLTQQVEGSEAAFRKLQQIVGPTIKGAADDTTKLAKAWHDLSEALTSDRGVVGGLGTALGTLLAHLLDLVTGILTVLEKIREYTPNLPASIRQGRLVIGSTAESGNNLVGLRPVGGTGFQTFGAPEQSIAAGVRQIQIDQEKHQQMSLRDLIAGAVNPATGQRQHGWAPASENDVEKYLTQLKSLTGMDVEKPFDARDRETVTKIIRGISQIESGHKVSDEVINKGVEQAFAGTPTQALGGVSQKDIDQADQASKDALSRRIRDNQAAQQEMDRNAQAALQRAEAAAAAARAGGRDVGTDPAFKTASAQAEDYTRKLEDLRHAGTNLITEQENIARSLRDQVIVLKETGAAAKEDADILRQFQIAARGNAVDQAALADALKAAQDKRTEALKQTVRQMDQETASQGALIAATEAGGRALDHYTNFEKARIMALDAGRIGTKAYQDAVDAYTQALDRASAKERDIGAARDIAGFKQQNEELELQVKLIGASTAEINRQTAALQERHARGLAAGDTPSPEDQKAIDAATKTADAKTNVERLKQAYSEIEQFGTSVFDSIGSAMEASFQKGADAGKIWRDELGNIMNQVIKEFMKLAIINPLLNSLFGGNRTELGDVEDALGGGGGNRGAGGARSAGTSSGSGSGGLLGGLFGKIGDLFGGGGGGGSSGGSSGSGSSGGGTGLFNHAGGIFGGITDKLFGQGFYQGGGLFGALFGGGGFGAAGSMPLGMGSAGLSSGVGGDLFGSGGIFHSGGVVGVDAVPSRYLPGNAWALAPHFQHGMANDEFAAVLHRSERVLTANQNDRMEHVMNRVASGDHGGRGGGGGGPQVVMHINTPDADSFRASQTQINSRASAALNRTTKRNST